MNPDFFAGTVCEAAVAKLLRAASQHAEQAVSGITPKQLYYCRPTTIVRER